MNGSIPLGSDVSSPVCLWIHAIALLLSSKWLFYTVPLTNWQFIHVHTCMKDSCVWSNEGMCPSLRDKCV